jgi:lipid-binding SYLF domain-containing protein
VAGFNQRGEILLPGRFSTGIVTFTGPDYTAFPDSLVIAAGANISIAQTPGGSGNAATYVTTFDTTGNWTMPANVSVAGNVTGNNISATTAFQLPVYANATARNAAISNPAVGMLVVVGNTYQGYNGVSWGNITLT